MALNTDVLHDALDDFVKLMPEIKAVIAAKGSNVGADVTTVEHIGEAAVKAAANIGLPYAGTVQTLVVPLAHQLAGLFATWAAAKATAPAAP